MYGSESYIPSKPFVHILYLYDHNLYGHSMIQLLPTKLIDLVIPKNFNLDNYSDNGQIGCFLEVDLNCPHELIFTMINL